MVASARFELAHARVRVWSLTAWLWGNHNIIITLYIKIYKVIFDEIERIIDKYYFKYLFIFSNNLSLSILSIQKFYCIKNTHVRYKWISIKETIIFFMCFIYTWISCFLFSFLFPLSWKYFIIAIFKCKENINYNENN